MNIEEQEGLATREEVETAFRASVVFEVAADLPEGSETREIIWLSFVHGYLGAKKAGAGRVTQMEIG